MGQCLNEFWAKGPCMLNDMNAILLRFREEIVGIAGDISKMFQGIGLSSREQDYHRFLWRKLNSNNPPDHYVLTTVTFGDKPSPAIATCALRKTADMQKDEFPDVYELINKNSFVDDLITPCPDEESTLKLMQDTEDVLKKGGFNIKEWLMSGSHKDHAIEGEMVDCKTEKILGMLWKPGPDYFAFKLNINFSKQFNCPEERSLTIDNIREETPKMLSYRMVLSIIASIFDPLGLITPTILGAKVLMRKINLQNESSEGGKWDAAINEQLREEVIQFFINLFQIELLTFQRCTKPPNVLGKPTLIVFLMFRKDLI